MKVVAGKSDFETCPAGAFPAVCYSVVDLGTQEGKFGAKHEVRIYWEVHGDAGKMSDGRPFSVNTRYNLSMYEKSNLRKDLEAWRGKPFENLEEFEMANLIGAACYLNVVHTVKGDDTYADVKSIMPLPGGMPKPPMENDALFLSLEAGEYDVNAYNRLSERMQETVAKSPEWQALQQPGPNATERQPIDDDADVPF